MLEAKREPWGLGTMSHNTTTQEQDRTLMLQGGATQPGYSPDHKALCPGSPAQSPVRSWVGGDHLHSYSVTPRCP